ncbi:MAG TPA: M23 family metallopeptidase [Bacteroidales bacterium]|nr:M23 family metallopeptidase [Bacteroidales bacterium]HPT21870.1 M23 family metallopeptidase [Bacteroidales bacterium]
MRICKTQIIPVILIFMMAVSGCKKNNDKPDETPPVFSVTPVDISTVTSFIAFGADLSATQKNPAFEYVVNNSSVQVRSVCRGYIEDIRLNDNFPDYEIWIKTSSNSVYRLIYDHVLNLTVSKGDDVEAGEVLGVVGTGNRTELQINKIGDNNEELSYCPFDFGTSDFIRLHKDLSQTWCLTGTVVP